MPGSAGRRRVVVTVGIVVVATLLGACAQSHPAPEVAPPPPVPEVHQHHRPYSDVNPPPRRGGRFVVKVLSVSTGAPGADGHPARHRPERSTFWGEKVRTCLQPSSPHAAVVAWADWRAETLDGRLFPADPGGAQPLRRPAYPDHQVLAPGHCVAGWWLITVPQGSHIRAIQLRRAGGRC